MSGHVTLATLRLRREALLRQAALQRLSLSGEVAVLLAPLRRGLPGALAGKLKLPLLAGGGALGMVLAQPRRVVTLLIAAASTWKSARGALPLLRGVFKRRS